MAAKIFALVCGLAVFAQVTSAQCLGELNPFGGPIPDAFPLPGSGIPFGQYGPACGAHAGVNGISLSNLGASYGGGLAVTSSSPISPTGLRVTSENAVEGPLAIVGNLPFLGTVAVEGLYPTAGAGAVSYGCGNGVVGITSESIPSAPLAHAIAPTAVSQAGFSSLAPGLGYLGYQGYIGVPRGCGSIY